VRQLLSRIIHVFGESRDDEKIFMAKWDVKDGFWRMDNEEGEEWKWNFAHVMPQDPSEPTRLVVPISLQMGWVESPPYFCAATVKRAATSHRNIVILVSGLCLPASSTIDHYVIDPSELEVLQHADITQGLRYALEVYVDDFMAIIIPTLREQGGTCCMNSDGCNTLRFSS
jgi:hypothetical protein